VGTGVLREPRGHAPAAWSESRNSFNADLLQPDSQAAEEQWQKLYFRGLGAGGDKNAVEGHRTRLRLQPFAGARRLAAEKDEPG
jgi:hypothetical protein